MEDKFYKLRELCNILKQKYKCMVSFSFDEFQNIILYITSSSGYFNKKFIIDEDINININEIIFNFKEEVIKYTLDLEEGEDK